MRNTFVEFYKYLAETFVCFFEKPGKLVAGERYSLFFEKEEDLLEFKQALINYRPDMAHDFSYRHDLSSETYNSSFLELGSAGLIISSDIDTTENYLTTLRNLVSAQEGIFESKAILILFTGKLDSLLGGSGDLTKSGFPFNFEQFITELASNVETDSCLKSFEKVIILDNLKNRAEDLRLDNASIFDLSALVGVVNKGSIMTEDYHHLGLFPYEAMTDMSDSAVKTSLNDNLELYSAVETVMNYGNLSSDLEKRFSASGAKMIASKAENDEWQQFDFSDILSAKKKKEKNEPVSFLDVDRERLPQGIDVWDQPLNGTKSGKRTRSIIAFNNSKKKEYQLFLSFNLMLKGKINLISGGNAETRVELTKKSIRVTVSGEHYNEDFLDLEYTDENDSTAFRFRIWTLSGSSGFMKSFEKKFQILENGTVSLNSLDKIVFNPDAKEILIKDIYSGDTVELKEQQLNINFAAGEEGDEIEFMVAYESYLLRFKALKKLKTPGPIAGWEVWQDKRVHSKHFGHSYDELKDILKLTLKGVEYIVRDEFRKNLLIERQMMQLQAFSWTLAEDMTLSANPLQLSLELTEAYNHFFEAVSGIDELLPSLAYLGGDLKVLAENYVETYMAELAGIPEELPLSPGRHADLLKLGSIFDMKSGDVALGPLHPLNVAFQLEVNEQLGQSILYEAMLKKINAANLMPYLNWKPIGSHSEDLYCSRENFHSPEWIYYGNDNQSQQFGGKEYVRRLVNKKISEFVDNFESSLLLTTGHLSKSMSFIWVTVARYCRESLIITRMRFHARQIQKT
jgi:DNA phosphorothioation-dependent restriction protein DptH